MVHRRETFHEDLANSNKKINKIKLFRKTPRLVFSTVVETFSCFSFSMSSCFSFLESLREPPPPPAPKSPIPELQTWDGPEVNLTPVFFLERLRAVRKKSRKKAEDQGIIYSVCI